MLWGFASNSPLLNFLFVQAPADDNILNKLQIVEVLSKPFDKMLHAANGGFRAAGYAVIGVVLIAQVTLGILEIFRNKDTRLLDPSFWIRNLFVSFMVIGFGTWIMEPFVFENVRGNIRRAQEHINQANVLYGVKLEAIGKRAQNRVTALVTAEETGKNLPIPSRVTDGEDPSVASDEVITPRDLRGIIASAGLAGASGAAVFMIISMTLQLVHFALYASIISMFGPLCLAFGIHESTQDIALGYAKSFMVYCIFFIPIMLVCLDVGVELMINLSKSNFDQVLANQFTSDKMFSGLAGSVLAVIIIPMIGMTTLKLGPEILKGLLR
jgi:hypothetical protein